jgi:hypothetical protein
MVEQEPNDEGIRPSRWVAIRNTYPDLLNTTIKDWRALFDHPGMGRFYSGHPPRHAIRFRLPDGTIVESELIFIALDREDHVQKLRGVQNTGFWLNEMKELPRAVVDMADYRHGRYPSKATGGVRCTWHGIIGDSNAWDEDHWLYSLLSEGDLPAGWSFHRQPGGVMKQGSKWVINPAAENVENLPGKEDYYIKGLESKTEDWIKVNLANEYGFVIEGKPVHPEYKDSLHCAPDVLEPVKDLDFFVGMDFGLTPAAVIFQQTASGQVRVIDEVVTEDMAATEFGPQVLKTLNKYVTDEGTDFIGDPAGTGRSQADKNTPFKALRTVGIDARPAGTNDFDVRQIAVSSLLRKLDMSGEPAILISPKCRTLRKGLSGGYCFKRLQVAGEDRYRDVPDKTKYSHVCEAFQYGLLGAGQGYAQMQPPRNRRRRAASEFYDPMVR